MKNYSLQEAFKELNQSKKTLKESDNQPVNLDYHKGDKFLDMLWDRLSPEYKVASVDTNWDGLFEYSDDAIFKEDPITYIVMPEADYNDYAEDLVRSGSRNWDEIFEDIMDEYPVFDVWYKNGKIYLFTSNYKCGMEFNPDADYAEYKEYTSIDDLVSEVLGL